MLTPWSATICACTAVKFKYDDPKSAIFCITPRIPTPVGTPL